MTDKYLLDENGEPQPCPDLMDWARWFQISERSIARTEIGKIVVSTVFLGLDHGYGSGPPVLFETMVFEGPLNGEQVRYCTRAEALSGHEEMVNRVKASVQ